MRTSIKWLKDYVDFDLSPEQLADKLTMAGVPVEGIEYLGKDIDKVITGKIVDVQHHPQADRLLVCKLDMGGEILTIVTGATNVAPGQIVPVAVDGSRLPKGEIHTTMFRGIESQGMLCSAEELMTDPKIIPVDAKDGIYILPANTPIGVDAKTVIGLDDVALEFELTANRADCFCVLGLAREIAALTGATLKRPMLNLKEAGEEKAASLVTIDIQDRELCPRFAARIFKDVKVGPSPAWMQQRIRAAGMRPINNIVDVTNFVMLELGQPMHAYDYNMLSRHTVIARRANPGERLTTLDGSKRELNSDMLVIADAVQAAGIAGVMGGLTTEVTDHTQTILLEAAAFNGPSIRRTSRALGLRSEASGRFERGVDVANITRALDRAAKLLEDMGSVTVLKGIADNYSNVVLPSQVVFTANQINDHLGTHVPQSEMLDILKRLEFDCSMQGDVITATVPSWRGDVTGLADISEEIARLHGFENIPSTVPKGAMRQGSQDSSRELAGKIRDTLVGTGFTEIISFSFTHPDTLTKLQIPAGSVQGCPIPVMNPITDDFPVLRTSLLSGVMDTVVRNFSRKNEDMKLFEIGPVYLAETLPLTKQPQEPMMLCGVLTGQRYETAWNQSRDMVDFFDAKGAVEAVLSQLGILDVEFRSGTHCSTHPGKTAEVRLNGEKAGVVGELHPRVLTAFGITRPVYMFEINMDCLVVHARKVGEFQSLPKFPAIFRDLAVVLPQDVPAASVGAIIKNAGGELLEDAVLFDVYEGGQVPSGFRSMAFSLTFRHAARTLTDEDVSRDYDQIVRELSERCAAKIRS